MGCCRRLKRDKGKMEVEDGPKAYEVSAPVIPTSAPVKYETVLVTRQNGVDLSETQISSDSTILQPSLRRKRGENHQVISTIRRSHSIDEGTQTDNEEAESNDAPPQKLSVTEAQELGYLVDVMKYYNSRLDDDFYPDLKMKTNSEKPKEETKFHFSEPTETPYVRETKPLLSNTSTETDRYTPPFPSIDDRFTLPRQPNNSRNPSEVSYETSTSNVSHNSLDLYSSEAIFNGNTLRQHSMQRKPKLGVRGDGYEFIVADSRTTPNF